MNQNIWGPHAWFFLHTITFNYPEKPKQCDKDRYLRFFTSLQDVIPCKYCRNNYKRHLKEYPIKLESRYSLSKWLVDVHNSVNSLTGKKTISYKEAVKIWEKNLGKILSDNDPCNHHIDEDNEYVLRLNFLDFISIIAVLILFYLFYKLML